MGSSWSPSRRRAADVGVRRALALRPRVAVSPRCPAASKQARFLAQRDFRLGRRLLGGEDECERRDAPRWRGRWRLLLAQEG